MSWRQLNFFSQTQKTISLKITTVDMKRPPPDFRSNFEAAQPPILIDNGIAILENEKIERHIMKAIPGGHNLFVADVEVAKKIENLYNKFMIVTTYNAYHQLFDEIQNGHSYTKCHRSR